MAGFPSAASRCWRAGRACKICRRRDCAGSHRPCTSSSPAHPGTGCLGSREWRSRSHHRPRSSKCCLEWTPASRRRKTKLKRACWKCAKKEETSLLANTVMLLCKFSSDGDSIHQQESESLRFLSAPRRYSLHLGWCAAWLLGTLETACWAANEQIQF